MKHPRVRKKNVSAEEWIAHRKLRKKIASAKWYAKKKQKEIEEERALRKKLKEEELERQRDYIWTEHMRAEWTCVLAHMIRKYPVRPSHIPLTTWVTWIQNIEDRLQGMRRMSQQGGEGPPWSRHIPWNRQEFMTILRQLSIRELMEDFASVIDSHSSIHDNHSVWKQVQSWLHAEGCSPALCSGVGLVWAGLFHINQVFRFPDVCRAMIHVQQLKTTRDQIHEQPAPQTKPPIQNPIMNDCLDHPIIDRWIEQYVFPPDDDNNEELEEENITRLHGVESPLVLDLFPEDWYPESDSDHDSDCTPTDGSVHTNES